MAPTRVPSGEEEEGEESHDARKRKRERGGGVSYRDNHTIVGGCVRVINDSIVRELFIYHHDRARPPVL